MAIHTMLINIIDNYWRFFGAPPANLVKKSKEAQTERLKLSKSN